MCIQILLWFLTLLFTCIPNGPHKTFQEIIIKVLEIHGRVPSMLKFLTSMFDLQSSTFWGLQNLFQTLTCFISNASSSISKAYEIKWKPPPPPKKREDCSLVAEAIVLISLWLQKTLQILKHLFKCFPIGLAMLMKWSLTMLSKGFTMILEINHEDAPYLGNCSLVPRLQFPTSSWGLYIWKAFG